jgi:hypothetical protein
LEVWSKSAPINSQKFQTELKGPQCTRVKIQTFKCTSNNPTSLIEDVIFLELGLYHSNYYINIVEATIDVLYVLQ